jgi:hypothetical protein
MAVRGPSAWVVAAFAAVAGAAIGGPGPIRKILEPPPVSPARGPPADWGELVQIHDDRETVQVSPDELPVIDIHSL